MSHIDKYLHSMLAVCPDIQMSDLDEFKTHLEVKRFKKKEHLFDLNDYHNHVVFISSGLVQSYYIDQKGEEKTAWFIDENGFVTDYPCFLNEAKSYYAFQCLEPVESVWLPKKAIYESYERYPAVQKYGRLIAEEILKIQQLRIESLLFNSSKQRYVEFLENYPAMIPRISQKHMASFIGIERQSLTRIRKEILSDAKS
ncbi:MAG: Crp/Fnr family transcriptional regulator [Crocinitomicaceae bacterium]